MNIDEIPEGFFDDESKEIKGANEMGIRENLIDEVDKKYGLAKLCVKEHELMYESIYVDRDGSLFSGIEADSYTHPSSEHNGNSVCILQVGQGNIPCNCDYCLDGNHYSIDDVESEHIDNLIDRIQMNIDEIPEGFFDDESKEIKGANEMKDENIDKYYILDNGGETIDRYTLITKDGEMYGFNGEPFAPQGFGQYAGTVNGVDPSALNEDNIAIFVEEYMNENTNEKEITIDKLPPNAQKFVKERINENHGKDKDIKSADTQDKSDEDIEKEFEGFKVTSLEWKDENKMSGTIIIEFPNAGESVGGGGVHEVVENFIIYDSGKIGFDNWYPENVSKYLEKYILRDKRAEDSQDFIVKKGDEIILRDTIYGTIYGVAAEDKVFEFGNDPDDMKYEKYIVKDTNENVIGEVKTYEEASKILNEIKFRYKKVESKKMKNMSLG
jgi:hypothetical protein